MEQTSSFDRHVLVQFETGLREQQQELRRMIDRVEKELRGVNDCTADNIDLSCYNSMKESAAVRSSQSRGKLKLVERALERIQDGTFGTCAACGGAIALKRLQAVPSTSHCISCQELLERSALGMATSAAAGGEFVWDCTP